MKIAPNRRMATILSAAMSLALLAACNMPGTTNATQTPTLAPTITPTSVEQAAASPTSVPPTPTLPPPTATATATALPPTATIAPSETAPATLLPTQTASLTPSASAPTKTPAATTVAATRITFAPQSTSASIEGTFPADGVQRYVLQAMAGQLMQVELMTPSSSARLAVLGADGSVLKRADQDGPGFTGTLPATQDYIFEVSAGSSMPYTLNVTIPQRITFKPGGTFATVKGSLAAHQTRHYVVRAYNGQSLRVSADVPGNEVRMVIYGADGTVLKSGMSLSPTFSGTFPSTQDYVIAISASAAPLDYALTVIIPERIRFQPNATSAVIEGQVAARSTRHYILGASANQTMRVELVPDNADIPAQLVIYGVDGSVFKSGMGEGLVFEGTLPSTQDYMIQVSAADQAVSYRLEIAIE
ncbi:MAG: hypothetical protein GX552_19080 [Chloroflexi bacterium]|nr:hypothetical protein [Chloroflexota bacterium]